jgi:hypothetical protein
VNDLSESEPVIDALIERLKAAGVRFDPGLGESECQRIEEQGGFRFPADLRGLYRRALPIGDGRGDQRGFPNWRKRPQTILRGANQYLLAGFLEVITLPRERLQDILPPSLEALPTKRRRAITALKGWLTAAPRLVPIYGHRFIPVTPPEPGNPIFSIVGVDIVRYGADLFDYFVREFDIPPVTPPPPTPRPIPFWDEWL